METSCCSIITNSSSTWITGVKECNKILNTQNEMRYLNFFSYSRSQTRKERWMSHDDILNGKKAIKKIKTIVHIPRLVIAQYLWSARKNSLFTIQIEYWSKLKSYLNL